MQGITKNMYGYLPQKVNKWISNGCEKGSSRNLEEDEEVLVEGVAPDELDLV